MKFNQSTHYNTFMANKINKMQAKIEQMHWDLSQACDDLIVQGDSDNVYFEVKGQGKTSIFSSVQQQSTVNSDLR